MIPHCSHNGLKNYQKEEKGISPRKICYLDPKVANSLSSLTPPQGLCHNKLDKQVDK